MFFVSILGMAFTQMFHCEQGRVDRKKQCVAENMSDLTFHCIHTYGPIQEVLGLFHAYDSLEYFESLYFRVDDLTQQKAGKAYLCKNNYM